MVCGCSVGIGYERKDVNQRSRQESYKVNKLEECTTWLVEKRKWLFFKERKLVTACPDGAPQVVKL